MMTTYRAAVIGLGSIGGGTGQEASHAAGYTACARVRLVAGCDLNPERLAAFGRHWHVAAEHLYTSHEEMLRRERPDLVSVATHNLHHHQPVIDAARWGAKGIWCEKPMALCVRDARAMIAACRQAGAVLLVNHNRRFQPNYRAVAQAVREGLIGPLRHVMLEFSRPLLHNGTHGVDLVLMMVGERPCWAQGHLRDEPVADPGGVGLFGFPSGTVAVVNCLADRRFAYANLILQGEQGRIEIAEGKNQWLAWKAAGGKNNYEPIPIPGLDLSLPRLLTWDQQAAHLIACIETGGACVSDGEAGLAALECIVACHVSHLTGRRIDLPLPERLWDYAIRSTGQ